MSIVDTNDRSSLLVPPVLKGDLYSEKVILNPFPFFEKLRETAPVVQMPLYDAYAIGRYDDVRFILRDDVTYSTTSGIGLSNITKPGAWGRKPSVFSEVTGAEHARNRGVLTRIMSPIVVRRWKEGFQEVADRLVDETIAKGEIDGVRDVAEAFILQVLPGAIGLTISRDQAVAFGDLNFNQLGPNNALLKTAFERAEPHMAWYNAQLTREMLAPNTVGAQIYEAADQGLIPEDVPPEMIRAFLRAGMDTTISGIGSTLYFLATHPEQWELLRSDPAKASRAAFEEAIRLETPSQHAYRTTIEDVDLSGYLIPAESKIAVLFASANRDPRKWENPDVYDIRRDTLGHMAFGDGPHVCLGQNMARMEAECIIGAIARKIQSISLIEKPVRRLGNTLRTLERLPLRVVPA